MSEIENFKDIQLPTTKEEVYDRLRKDNPFIDETLQMLNTLTKDIHDPADKYEILTVAVIAYVQQNIASQQTLNSNIGISNNSIKDSIKELKDNFNQRMGSFEEALMAVLKTQSIEQKLQNTADMCQSALDCDCEIYFNDPDNKDALYTFNEFGEKIEIYPEKNSVISTVLNNQSVEIHNNGYDISIGDNENSPNNVMVVPVITEKTREVAAVAVFKNKEGGFEEKMAKVIDDNVFISSATKNIANQYSVHSSIYDLNTGAYSRVGLNGILPDYIKEMKEGKDYYIMAVDFDDFKSINESVSHGAGDTALRTFVSRAKDAVGEKGEVVRLGGDEFLVILEAKSAEKAFDTFDSIRRNYQETDKSYQGTSFKSTISGGYIKMNLEDYLYARRSEYYDIFMKKTYQEADDLLGEAKHLLGKNIVCSDKETMTKIKINNRQNDDFTINSCTLEAKVEEIYNTPSSLHENGKAIASMNYTDKNGLTVDIKLKVQGDAVLQYEGDTYSNPSEYTRDLITRLKSDNRKEIETIVPNNYVAVYTVTDKDGNEVASGNQVWKDDILLINNQNSIRKDLIDCCASIVVEYEKSAIEQNKTLSAEKTATNEASKRQPRLKR